jgi:hypothetical protein
MDEMKQKIKNIINTLVIDDGFTNADGYCLECSHLNEKSVDNVSEEITKLKNFGEGEAGTGYALLSDGWCIGEAEKPNDREEVILCLNIELSDYVIGMYRQEFDSIFKRHTDDKYNINYYKWKRITAPSF